jgi:hypothetical protein
VYSTLSGLTLLAVFIDEKYALLVDMADSSAVFNFSKFACAPFIVWTVFHVGLVLRLVRCNRFTIKLALWTVNLMVLLTVWLPFILWHVHIYHFGHVPVLDVLYRSYDLQSVCWHDVYTIDVNRIAAKQRNCFLLNEFNIFLQKCVGCRKIVHANESTFLNQNYTNVAMCIIVLVVCQVWCMNKIINFDNNNTDKFSLCKTNNIQLIDYIEQQNDHHDTATILEKKKEDEEDEEDEEEIDRKNSEMRCFQQILSSRTPSPSNSLSSPSPPIIYSVPKRIKCKHCNNDGKASKTICMCSVKANTPKCLLTNVCVESSSPLLSSSSPPPPPPPLPPLILSSFTK